MIPFHAHLDVVLVLGAVEAAYLLMARDSDATTRNKVVFSLGVFTLFVASVWPMHDLAEGMLYSVHMVQHTLYTLVAAPLLVAGLPASVMRRLIAQRPVYAVARFVTRPFIALATFNLVIIVTHIPAVVALNTRSELFHFAAHTVLVLAALVMWMPLLSPVLELPRISYPKQMMYLFLQSILPTVPASFLTFGDAPLYRSYHGAFGISALSDMRMAGLFMKIVGGFILWGFIVTIFFKWYATETREGVDVLQWQDVNKQLNRTKR